MPVFDKLDNLTRKVDKMALEEVALRKAYRQSTAEIAALKATVDTLMKQLDKRIVNLATPLPDLATSPTAHTSNRKVMVESTFKYKVKKPQHQARLLLGKPQSYQLGVGL
jgi:regulator of replication initiation timing